MKIVVALSRFPYPTEKGDKLRAYHQVAYLHRHHEVYLVCLSEEDISADELAHMRGMCKELHVINLPRWQRLLNLSQAVFNGLPFQVNYFYSDAMKRKIADLVQQHNIDVCYVQLIRLGLNIPFGLTCGYYLDYMDSFSSNFQKRVPLSKWYEQPVVAGEAERLTKYEIAIAEKFQGYSVISPADKSKFTPELAEKLEIIPNGVGERFLNYTSPISDQVKKYDLIFTGNMGYHPNVQACLFLVNKILPLLEKKGLNLKVCLAGTSPAAAVQALENHRAVTVTGFVPDLREYMAAARIFVAPLFSGAGLQNKLLEAMAMGMPVLTSPDTNQALGARNTYDLIECGNEQSFADQIEYLLDNPAESQKLGEAGRNFVQNEYDWDSANRMLELSLQRVVQIM